MLLPIFHFIFLFLRFELNGERSNGIGAEREKRIGAENVDRISMNIKWSEIAVIEITLKKSPEVKCTCFEHVSEFEKITDIRWLESKSRNSR